MFPKKLSEAPRLKEHPPSVDDSSDGDDDVDMTNLAHIRQERSASGQLSQHSRFGSKHGSQSLGGSTQNFDLQVMINFTELVQSSVQPIWEFLLLGQRREFGCDCKDKVSICHRIALHVFVWIFRSNWLNIAQLFFPILFGPGRFCRLFTFLPLLPNFIYLLYTLSITSLLLLPKM